MYSIIQIKIKKGLRKGRKEMKKGMALFLSAALSVAAMTGCGNSGKEKGSDSRQFQQ